MMGVIFSKNCLGVVCVLNVITFLLLNIFRKYNTLSALFLENIDNICNKSCLGIKNVKKLIRGPPWVEISGEKTRQINHMFAAHFLRFEDFVQIYASLGSCNFVDK